MLIHPEHFIQTYVINVAPNDKLKLRAGPGTKFRPVTEIPPDSKGITVFDRDLIWDGDTWWYPVEWHGFRGYVGRHYLQESLGTPANRASGYQLELGCHRLFFATDSGGNAFPS
jgi:hypothetical protein